MAARKDAIRAELILEHRKQLEEHVATLVKRVGGSWLPVIDGGFAEAMKGKKTIAGLRDGLHDALTAAKMRASQLADTIQINYNAMTFDGEDWSRLFPDFQTVCTKAPDDFKLLLESRVRSHKEAEQKRLDDERERIRQEEEAKAAAKVKAEQEATAAKTKEIGTALPVNETGPATFAAAAAPAPAHPVAAPSRDTITEFLNSREWKRGEEAKAMAILIEYHKFLATAPTKKAA